MRRYGSTPSDRQQRAQSDGRAGKNITLTLDRWEIRGTVAYGAPEMLQDHPSGQCKVFTTKADVWSATIIVWESWAQQPWIDTTNTADVIKAVTSGKIPDITKMPPFLAAVIRYGLLRNDSKRPEASVSCNLFTSGGFFFSFLAEGIHVYPVFLCNGLQ